MMLGYSTLFRQQALIGGKWLNAADGSHFVVHNPANSKAVGHAPRCTVADTEHAIEAAHTAFPAWRDQTAKTRAQLLHRWFELILQHRDDLAIFLVSVLGFLLFVVCGVFVFVVCFIEWFVVVVW